MTLEVFRACPPARGPLRGSRRELRVKVPPRTAEIHGMGFECLQCGKTCPEGTGPFCSDDCREARARERREWYVRSVLPAGSRWRTLAVIALAVVGIAVLTGSWFWAVAFYGAGAFFWFRSQVARSRVSLLADGTGEGEGRVIRLGLWPALLVRDIMSHRKQPEQGSTEQST